MRGAGCERGPRSRRWRAIAQRARSGRGAHVKRPAHVRDAGGVPAQRLVEGPRVLSRVSSRVHTCGAGCERAVGARGRRRAIAACTQHARMGESERLCTIEGQCTGRAAHHKHVSYVCDAGGVPGQRLVERVRVLPAQMGEGERSWGTEPHRARGEQHTLNIQCMSVTLDVSQLKDWLKALARCHKDRKQHTRGASCGPGGRRRPKGGWPSQHARSACRGEGTCDCRLWGSAGRWEQRARETCRSCP